MKLLAKINRQEFVGRKSVFINLQNFKRKEIAAKNCAGTLGPILGTENLAAADP
jgi:hypothetical protein